MTTPSRSRITAATRGAVQRSVRKPKSQGLCRTQPSTSRACPPPSFGGRPDRGAGSSAASPLSAQARTHRSTDRRVTRRDSPTSPGDSPSSTRPTANRRTSGNDSAFHGDTMQRMMTKFMEMRHD